ncbi:aldolase [Sistotremastrum suecicum HHB10207 ss-3]|uniref:Aldolase n=1 Tax=Sistotremastrum suecicum HHB10207 ss-3 TaxID=1314776 RepID=A0A166E0M3_9AGAM|nr:aldolase [Sistotremastrum suecicum HHB10207 ss-3]
MAKQAPPQGIYVPAVVYFDSNEEIDTEGYKAHILRLARGGVTGILVQGSNGEAQHLSHLERFTAIGITRKTLDENGFKDTLVIAGTGAQSTRETITLCEEAQEAGASHALVLTPSTWAPAMSKANILTFHRTAHKSPIPIMIYNFPTVTAGQNLTSEVIAELAKHPNIVGTKLSCGDIGKAHRLCTTFPPSEFAVFPGKSDVMLPGLLCGSAGIIGALVNLAPKLHKKLYDAYRAGRVDEAKQIQEIFSHADAAVGTLGGIAGLKRAISEHFGYGVPYVRGPLLLVSKDALQSPAGDWIAKLVELEKAA